MLMEKNKADEESSGREGLVVSSAAVTGALPSQGLLPTSCQHREGVADRYRELLSCKCAPPGCSVLRWCLPQGLIVVCLASSRGPKIEEQEESGSRIVMCLPRRPRGTLSPSPISISSKSGASPKSRDLIVCMCTKHGVGLSYTAYLKCLRRLSKIVS